MREAYFPPVAQEIAFRAVDVITISDEIPAYDEENSGEWEDF